MTARFIAAGALGPFLQEVLAGREVYGGTVRDGDAHLARLDAAEVGMAPSRTVEPLKCLYFSPRSCVAGYFGSSGAGPAAERAVVGVRACDLAALKVLDYVFLEGSVVDPAYKERRDHTLLVSADCAEPREACFCTFPGGQPYPEEGYDLNLSPVRDGYVVETGSTAMEAPAAGLPEATPEQLAERDRNRAAVTAGIEGAVQSAGLGGTDGLQARVQESFGEPLWDTLAESCVECGACNFICPTCHCFLLIDLEEREGFRRFSNWDSCLYPAFAREASGANPRARRAERLHGRMEKKFDFMKTNAGVWGCVGCGRCIEACAGKIDVRKTLKELANA